VGVQGEARSVLDGAREAGVEDERLKFASDSAEAGELVSRFVRSGDVVLIKGSRGVKLELVLSALRQTYSSVEA
jgi:UDP-N-acetylmuramoyl-tripeptide--D-alanyl-D-alanine ligase